MRNLIYINIANKKSKIWIIYSEKVWKAKARRVFIVKEWWFAKYVEDSEEYVMSETVN